MFDFFKNLFKKSPRYEREPYGWTVQETITTFEPAPLPSVEDLKVVKVLKAKKPAAKKAVAPKASTKKPVAKKATKKVK